MNYENIDHMLRKAVYIVGSQSELARKMGVNARTPTQWKSKGYVPSHNALDMEKATNGVITIRDVLMLEKKILDAKKKAKG
jgi:DNA-binding transcriptional regulator YdaS (Cro superfamily)